jgi:lipooligosaccharide transport system ATP-binding protein
MSPTDKEHSSAAIRLRGVVKRFGPITAVDGLDLEVPYGTCVGLLGPNGAGKSTTMKALTAQVIADEGRLEVLGYQLPQDSKQARAQMGVVPQLDNLDVALTAAQNLRVFAHLYRVPSAERGPAIERVLRIVNLLDRADSIVDHLSGGMRRRLGSPARLAEVEAEARSRGWQTRRTGTSVALLGSNGAAGFEGERRTTNLEDVFVLLTGEEIE